MKLRFIAALLILCASLSAQQSQLADKVIVHKEERRLELQKDGKLIKQYKIALGGSPVGAKTRQGDQKTPEGDYVIDSRNPQSAFYKSLHVSYPNGKDRAAAKAKGVSPGGDIFIHGLGKQYGWVGQAHSLKDWTLGCIAVTNEEIDEIWALVPDGIPVEIRP